MFRAFFNAALAIFLLLSITYCGRKVFTYQSHFNDVEAFDVIAEQLTKIN